MANVLAVAGPSLKYTGIDFDQNSVESDLPITKEQVTFAYEGDRIQKILGIDRVYYSNARAY